MKHATQKYDALNFYVENVHVSPPEFQLLAGIIKQAINDFTKLTHGATERDQESAYRWLFTDFSETPLAFAWCCMNLGWDPITIRTGLRQRYKEILTEYRQGKSIPHFQSMPTRQGSMLTH